MANAIRDQKEQTKIQKQLALENERSPKANTSKIGLIGGMDPADFEKLPTLEKLKINRGIKDMPLSVQDLKFGTKKLVDSCNKVNGMIAQMKRQKILDIKKNQSYSASAELEETRLKALREDELNKAQKKRWEELMPKASPESLPKKSKKQRALMTTSKRASMPPQIA